MIRCFRSYWFSAAVALAIGPLFQSTVYAQDDAKPLRLLVNGAPGSVADMLARPLADSLAKLRHVPVIVENRPGAGSFLSVAELMRSPADGHTLMMISAATVIWNKHLFKKLPYDPDRDFIPVGLVASIPMMLAVNPAVPASNIESFLKLVKASPQKYTFGYGGVGNAAHISFARFKTAAGLDMVPIGYKSGPAALQDLMGGHIDAMLDGVPLLAPQVKDGRLRALAVATKTRVPSLPDVPTMEESGLPGFEAEIWVGLAAKQGTSAAIVGQLNGDVNSALDTQAVRDVYQRIGADIRESTPSDFARFIRSEDAIWGPVIQQAGIRLD